MSRLLVSLMCMAFLFGCDKKSASTSASPATNAVPAQGSKSTPPAPETWESVPVPEQTDAHEPWRFAQQDLKHKLGADLKGAVASDGFAKSLVFCRGAAPGVAAEIGARHKVKIGRTSHRLRNPENQAPTWAADAVAAAKGEALAFRSSSGRLGFLSPIKTGALCVNCHGSAEQLADGVADELSKSYPDDKATGFAEGDLRGWFWVEVEPES